MRRIAKRFGGLCLLTFFGCGTVLAQVPNCTTELSPDKRKNWYLHAQSQKAECCCGDYDGIREGTVNPPYGEFVEWTIENGHYRVKITPPHPEKDEKPQWYDVPDSALVKEQDRKLSTPPPFAEVWTGGWIRDIKGKRTPRFRCVYPGAGM